MAMSAQPSCAGDGGGDNAAAVRDFYRAAYSAGMMVQKL